MGSLNPKPDYGRRLLPAVIDDAAVNNPDHVVYTIPLTDGFREISHKTFANAINRAAWWLENSLGRSVSFEAIGYMGVNDLRYQILFSSAIKSGYTMLFNSPRNSLEGHLAVIDAADCKIWCIAPEKNLQVEQILSKREMHTVFLPSLDNLLDDTPVNHYPYTKTYDEAKTDPALILHTSGSTGVPKPIVMVHGLISTCDAFHLLPKTEGKQLQLDTWTNQKFLTTFPPFHSGGVVISFHLPFFYGLSMVLPPPDKPVNQVVLNAILDTVEVQGAFLAPSTVEEMVLDPDSFERAKKLRYIITGGGPIGKKAGDKVMTVSKLENIIGVTEGSLFPIVQADPEDWQYFHVHPAAGFEYRPYGNGLYEQFQIRDPELEPYQGFCKTFPELAEVRVKDLYEKHPTKPNRYLYRGRADDIIVLVNGEKVNPLDMEASINGHPAVKATLVVGQARFHTAVIVELRNEIPESKEEKTALLKSLWEAVRKANDLVPKHGKVHENYIMFSDPKKPFLRSGKGSIQRAFTVQMYKDEIDNLYANASQEVSSGGLMDTTSLESVSKGVRGIIVNVTENKDIGEEQDIFLVGVDSLGVFAIQRRLRAVLEAKRSNALAMTLTTTMIYTNPTIEMLSEVLYGMLQSGAAQGQDLATTNVKEMEALIQKHTRNLPVRTKQETEISTSHSVILTGSTGSLGTYLLDSLLSHSHISRIYCLNRSVDGQSRQTSHSSARGLSTNWSGRVTFLQVDLSKSNFGLPQEDFDMMLQSTTHIIHNQWQVDFNLSLSSFEPHIKGVRNLIDFSATSTHTAKIFFISSIGVALNHSESSLPETIINDLFISAMGYGSSKLVSELILEEARKTSGIEVAICRVGQIAGPVKKREGMWNKQEWFPTIIATSRFLGAVPENLASMDRIDFMPVDDLSNIILELADLDDAREECWHETKIYHAVNPATKRWLDFVSLVAKALGDIKIVSWEEWMGRLRESIERGEVENPGAKLLQFYEGIDARFKAGRELTELRTDETLVKSPILKELGPVTKDWMSRWLEQWNF